jgi:predicted RND superfamily exporter protein
MRNKVLKQLADWHSSHPWRMLLVVLLVTVILTILSGQLSVTMRWSDLLPENDPRTIQFNKIIEDFKSSSSIIVLAQGREERIKEFADALAPRLLRLADENGFKYVQRVDYKAETDFLRQHGFMLMKEKDLRNMKEVFTDPNLRGLLFNINNAMEKEYIGDAESMSTREKEDNAVIFLDGMAQLITTLQDYCLGEIPDSVLAIKTADKLLLGEPYFLSYDEKALILNAIPNFSMMDTELMVKGTDAVQAELDSFLTQYPDVRAGLTGMIPIGHDEMVYSEQSLGYTTVIALIAILLMLIVSLRMWIAPLLALFNLLIGIIWAIGLTAVVVGQLNIMTQMMAVILLGLGIDFAIHLISNFTEQRAKKLSIAEAMSNTCMKSGKGVVTGGLTTMFAFLTMVISSSRGMKEMGIVTGLGLLAILVETLLFLPVLLVLRERRRERRHKVIKKRDLSFRFLGASGQWLGRRYRFTIIASVMVTLLLAWAGSNITFDHNYLNIEPEGLTSIILQDTVLDKFDLSMDYAMVIAENVDQSRQFAEAYRDVPSVAMAEDISLYLPSVQQQEERRPHLREIREALTRSRVRDKVHASEMPEIIAQVERLEMNIMEMQDMAFLGGQDKVDHKCQEIVGIPGQAHTRNIVQDLSSVLETQDNQRLLQGLSAFQRAFGAAFRHAALKMCSTEQIRLRDLPESILDRYSNDARNQFLVTVFPSGSIWQNAAFLDRFAQDLQRITPKATGMPPIFSALIEIIGRDGRNAIMLTVVIVFLLLWMDFGKVQQALIAMLPLAAGLVWMVGLMHLTGQQFTVMNVMGLPMILGIGIDDGVHIVHRWLHEGKNQLQLIFASTGKAILLTSLTTMLAFGSLMFSIWRGFAQLGGALFVGVAACFLTTVIILPGIIGWMEHKKGD